MKIINVIEDKCEERIDKYLIEELGVSRSKIQKLMENDKIMVNDNKVKNSYFVHVDDVISIDEDFNLPIDIVAENIPLDIVYEDEDLIVVNKPSGMVVHPAAGHYSGTLVNALMYHCNQLSGINGLMRPGIVHRIDKDTSGLLLVAKNDETHASLAKQLQEHTITRRYLALVEGIINNDYGTIDAPIGRDPVDRKKMAVTDSNAKEAITNFTVLERIKGATLIECKLETGRTHQIRLHMQYIGHPVYGDPQYGFRNDDNTHGQYLHAKVLGFVHPRTNEHMYFEAPLPDFFEEKIKELGGEYNG